MPVISVWICTISNFFYYSPMFIIGQDDRLQARGHPEEFATWRVVNEDEVREWDSGGCCKTDHPDVAGEMHSAQEKSKIWC